MKNNLVIFTLVSTIISAMMACTSKSTTDLTKVSIIPKPVSVTADSGTFALTTRTDILVPEEPAEIAGTGQYLADMLNRSTGLGLDVVAGSKKCR